MVGKMCDCVVKGYGGIPVFLCLIDCMVFNAIFNIMLDKW